MRRIYLFATLAVALLLRLPGIEWGLPPATPHVVASDFRSSYAFDEDDILSGAAKAGVRRFDFDPHEYHWGTLHIELAPLLAPPANCGEWVAVWSDYPDAARELAAAQPVDVLRSGPMSVTILRRKCGE